MTRREKKQMTKNIFDDCLVAFHCHIAVLLVVVVVAARSTFATQMPTCVCVVYLFIHTHRSPACGKMMCA